MKMKIIFLLLCTILLSSCATTGAKVTEPVIYSEVIDVTGVTQSVLYTKANMWFVDAFRNAGSVIQFSDKESGVIKGKYIGDDIMAGIYVCRISSTITVEVKEGRYRILFADPMYQYVGDVLNGMYARPGTEGAVVTQEMADKVTEEWVNIAADLKASIDTEESSW